MCVTNGSPYTCDLIISFQLEPKTSISIPVNLVVMYSTYTPDECVTQTAYGVRGYIVCC